jgi:hypothetical protein
MFFSHRNPLKLTGLLVGCSVQLCLGEFVAPEEGPSAFRRDQVPLDVAAMERLSQGFVVLAAESTMKTASERRWVAQMLALAVALDPTNEKAQSLIENLTNGRSLADGSVEAGQAERHREEIWQSISWLDTTEAKGQGRALVACLKDVMIFSDPKDPRAQASRDAGEQGAWAGWIPPLAAYETKEMPLPEKIVTAELTSALPPLATATLGTLLWSEDPDSDKERWILKKCQLEMSAEEEDPDFVGPNPFHLLIGSSAMASESKRMAAQISLLLKKCDTELPDGIRVTLAGKGLEKAMFFKKPLAVSGALSVLASAAATGRELGDLIVIGKVDAEGAFTVPTDIWAQLQALGPGNGERLVLPTAAAEYLPAMLALERPQFFMDYEVLLAADFKQLLDFTAKTPDAALARACEQFQEIRKKSASLPLGQYLANGMVRRRLAEMVQEIPSHFSAKILGIQGAGNRPTIITRRVLEAELRLAIEPMEWMVEDSADEFDREQLDQIGMIYETCRARVDGLIRYSDKADRELISKVQELVSGIRALERAAKSRGETYEVEDAMNEAQQALIRTHALVASELAPEKGDK